MEETKILCFQERGQDMLLGPGSYTNTGKKGRNSFQPQTFYKYKRFCLTQEVREVMLLRKADPQSPDAADHAND